MAANHRVHPSTEDVEAGNAGSTILAPNSSGLPSEKSEIDPPPGRQIRVLFPKDQVIPTRETPRYFTRPPKSRNSCRRCLWCTLWLQLAFIAQLVVVGGILYLVFHPKMPKYSVDSIQITNFSINADLSTNCQLSVNVIARNPNKKIGIYYLDNSHLAVLYSGVEVCTGTLPVFYQGHKNTTFLDVAFNGTGARLTSDMVSTLKKQEQDGSIPLNLKADVPVKIKLGKLKLMKMKVRVRWNLVADKLDANAKVTVGKSKVRLKLWGL